MVKISIVKVENPSCLWGRVFGGRGDTTVDYADLQTQMNLFYHDVTQDLHSLKPASFEEGQVYVVYWALKKSWCRAVVLSIIRDPTCLQTLCFLVDHGEVTVVPSENMRVASVKFLKLPFWVRKFHLSRVQPTTLRVSFFAEKAELKPSAQWDCSATLYLHNLLQASVQTEVVLHEWESESTAIELFVTIGNIKICVNDDLVAKRFAYYSSSGLDACDRAPLPCSYSILTPTLSKCSHKQTEQNLRSPGEHGGSSKSPDASEAEDGLTAPTLPQSGFPDMIPCEEEDSNHGRKASNTDRFMKFLSPDRGHQSTLSKTNDELNNTKPEQTEIAEASMELDATSRVSDTNVLNTSEERRTEAEMWKIEDDMICSRLLEWLNPEPFNSDPDATDEVALPDDPWIKGVLVHSPVAVEPWETVEDAPVVDSLRKVLRQKNYRTLSPAESYSWPAVARGCNTFIISQNADQPLGYLVPLLTHLLLNSVLLSHVSSSGPIAVLLCPGWEKAQLVYDLLEETNVSQTLHPLIMLVGIGKDQTKDVKIPKNCLLLVTTPFSLVRLLSSHCFLFLRLNHLLLDEADELFTRAPDQMESILQHFQKVTSSVEKGSCPRQLIAAARRWSSPMEKLISCHMPNPYIVISVLEEAALYGNIQQVVLITPENNKISVLLDALDFCPDVGQKTLIVANSAQEVEDVFQALSSQSAFCLKVHEGLLDQLDFVLQQWKKTIGPRTHIVLVSTSECLKGLGIRDASCVVHFGFPSSPRLFGSRLFCMAENFQNLSVQRKDGSWVTRSLLLVSERNARHVVGVLRYLGRTATHLPPVLLRFAERVCLSREEQKISRPLCRYLKSFGVCRDRNACPDRHRFNPHLDHSALPTSGVIEVLPLYIKTASVYYGRLVNSSDEGFESMASEINSYYADKKPGAKELLQGALYAVQEDGVFHRVKILSVPDPSESLFNSISVRFVDIGKEVEVKSYQVLELPEQFHSLPHQAVEMVVCGVKPVDAEMEWHPKVTRAISHKIRGLQHRARVVLSLGNTLFVHHMVRVTKMAGTRALINEYSLQSEILKTGMGVSNPEHLDVLRELLQDSVVNQTKDGGPTNGTMAGFLSEEQMLTAEFRDHEKHEALDPYELTLDPSGPMPPPKRSTVPEPEEPEAPRLPVPTQTPLLHRGTDGEQRNRRLPEETMRSDESDKDGRETDGADAAASVSLHTNGMADGDEHVVSAGGEVCNKSFSPQVVWFQTCDSVIVTVKLMNPEVQQCDFYADRVVYSGRVNGRSYRADLKLHQNIAADACHWEMKSNQPILKLVKLEPGYWERLVRGKNIFVSFDMDHVDEEEDESSGGLRFVGSPEAGSCYLSSDSDSD